MTLRLLELSDFSVQINGFDPSLVESTPAFVYDERAIGSAISTLRREIRIPRTQILFALKSFAIYDAVKFISKLVDGFSVSSLFEALLVRKVLEPKGTVQFVSPRLVRKEIVELFSLCDRVTFNSLPQWRMFSDALISNSNCGIRVNPKLSFTDDSRYDPCRKHSKLGVAIDELAAVHHIDPDLFSGLNGIHFHNNCVSSDWCQLLTTVLSIEERLSDLLPRLQWINFGGGYSFLESKDFGPLNEAISLMNSKYGLEVILEPGSAIVNSASWLVCSVIDIFDNDGKDIAILDTSVNHIPEVFEYQFEPDIANNVNGGRFGYILAGCSCLAGDVFGEYSFDRPLEVGQRLVFENVGAYSLVKAHMFNGINLPSIYAVTASGELVLKKEFTYSDFESRCGVEQHATATT